MTFSIYGHARDGEQALAIIAALRREYFPAEQIAVVCRADAAPALPELLGGLEGMELLTMTGVGPVLVSSALMPQLEAAREEGMAPSLALLGVPAGEIRGIARRLAAGEAMLLVRIDDAEQRTLACRILRQQGAAELGTAAPEIPASLPAA